MLLVPSLQRFVQNRQSQLQHHPDFHITSSTILASTLHITRLNMRNPGPDNTDPGSGPGLAHGADQARFPNGVQATGLQEPSETGNTERLGSPIQFPDPPDLQQTEAAPNPGAMNSSFSSLLLWILGGASSEGLNSFLSMFRDIRDQGQVYEESPQQNDEAQNSQ